MIIRGSVKLNRFTALYELVVRYNAIWKTPPVETNGEIQFEIEVTDKKILVELYQIFPYLKLSLWQVIKNFINKLLKR